MQVALHSKSLDSSTLSFIVPLLQYLSQQQARIFISPALQTLLTTVTTPLPVMQLWKKDLTPEDLVVSIGGDGTLLEAVNYVGAAETPVLGINTGRMGFLATVAPEEALDALGSFLQGVYLLDRRMLLQVVTAGATHLTPSFALNEIAVLKQDSSAMITIQVSIEKDIHTTYWADGLIVATPTGSTGYSLSCGGPIMLPSANSLVITPVSPHNLAVRPLVVPDSSLLSLSMKSRNQKFLTTLDGRSNPTSTNVQLLVSKAPFHAQLVKVGKNNIFDILRQKLHWGLDVRNQYH